MARYYPVLSVYNSDGKCISYCGKQCWGAMLPSESKSHRPCRCICGGRNRAAGYARAVRNTAAGIGLRLEDLAEFARLRNLDAARLVVMDRTRLTQEKARKRALAKLQPHQPGKDDLFYSYGLARIGVSEAPEDAGTGGARQRRG